MAPEGLAGPLPHPTPPEPSPLQDLLTRIGACRACAADFPHPPRSVLKVAAETRILICDQAPGRRVQISGLPFDDPSGERLRVGQGVDRAAF